MSSTARTVMSLDEFLRWAESQPSRYELVAGLPIAVAPERAGHARAKFRVKRALDAAIARGGLDCEAFIDGMTVRIDEGTCYEPDAFVRCGPRLPDDALVVTDPVIVVEVLSPSTRGRDAGAKLADYFRLPTLRHYLIVQTEPPLLIHHERDAGAEIRTRILRDGALRMETPPMELPLAELFPAE